MDSEGVTYNAFSKNQTCNCEDLGCDLNAKYQTANSELETGLPGCVAAAGPMHTTTQSHRVLVIQGTELYRVSYWVGDKYPRTYWVTLGLQYRAGLNQQFA